MAKKVLVLVGTKKGAFLLESDARRNSWELSGPFCETWPINHVSGDPRTGTIYATGGNEWFGPAVWKSTDLGKSWTHSSRGLPILKASNRSRPDGALLSVPADGFTPASSPLGCSTARMKGKRGAMYPAFAITRLGLNGSRGEGASSCTRSFFTRMIPINSGSPFRQPAFFIRLMVEKAGSRETAARGLTTCRKTSATRSTASVCTAS